ncbi:MAG: hypothetical protein QM739_07955 [Propionivibrio sp.]
MSDVADRNGIAAAEIEQAEKLPKAAVRPPDGETAATRFNHFAERVLPTLRQLRAARKVAETLVGGATSPALENVGRQALQSIRSIDAALRTTGVYDLSELAALETDATRMSAVCRVLDEVGARLHGLAQDVAQQAAQAGDADAAARLVALSVVLRTPFAIGPDGLDYA